MTLRIDRRGPETRTAPRGLPGVSGFESTATAIARTVTRRIRVVVAKHPTVFDGLVTLVIAVVTALPLFVRSEANTFWPRLLIHIGLMAPLTFRKRAPFAVFAACAAVALVQWCADQILPGDIALLIALYTVAANSALRRLALAVATMEVGAVLATARWATPNSAPWTFVFMSGMTTAAAVLGLNLRVRRAYLASLEDRAARLERERDQQAQIAAAAERGRIAREIHDIVSHSLSVMVALTDGASFALPTAPDRAADAIGKASDVGRQAMTEMQRILGVLRDGGFVPESESGAELRPQPGLGEIDELLADVRAAGLPVESVVEGRPPTLSPGLQLAVFRVVQEALTNTRKHAGSGASARVVLRYRDDAIEVEVTDASSVATGRAAESGTAGRWGMSGESGGHGIVGMRERIAPYGGVLETGPMTHGGWRVRASIPSPRAVEPATGAQPAAGPELDAAAAQ